MMQLTRTTISAAAFTGAMFCALPTLMASDTAAPLRPYNANIYQTSVSGVSSGGAMAVQMHIAHSSMIVGSGIIAGVSYDCADSRLPTEDDRLERGFYLCLKGIANQDEEASAEKTGRFSVARALDAYNAGGIDDPRSNLKDDKVWLFHGIHDYTIVKTAMDGVELFYREFVDPHNIFYKTNNDATHSFITNQYEKPCYPVKTDSYIADCGLDAAGSLLKHIYGVPADDTEGTWSKDNLLEFRSDGIHLVRRGRRVCRNR